MADGLRRAGQATGSNTQQRNNAKVQNMAGHRLSHREDQVMTIMLDVVMSALFVVMFAFGFSFIIWLITEHDRHSFDDYYNEYKDPVINSPSRIVAIFGSSWRWPRAFSKTPERDARVTASDRELHWGLRLARNRQWP